MFTTINLVMLVASLGGLIAFIFLLIAAFKRSILWGIVMLLIPFSSLVYAYKYWSEIKKPMLAYWGCNVVSVALMALIFVEMGGMEAVEMAQKIQSGEATEQEAAEFIVSMEQNLGEAGGPTRHEILEELKQDPATTPEQIAQAEEMFKQLDKLAQGEISSMEEGMRQLQEQTQAPAQPPAQPQAPAQVAEVKPQATPAPATPTAPTQVTTTKAAPQTATAPTQAKPAPTPAAQPAPTAPDSDIDEALKTFDKNKPQTITLDEAYKYIGFNMDITTTEGLTHTAILVGIKGDAFLFEQRQYGGALSFKLYRSKIKTMTTR